MTEKLLLRVATPRWLWVPATLALILLAGPLIALTILAPWGSLPAILGDPEVLTSLRLSLGTAAISTIISLLLGLPLAVLLHRLSGVARAVLYGFLVIPLVLSPVVSGLALLYFWGRRGLLGTLLENLGVQVGFSPVAVVLVQVFVALPFFVIAALGSFEGVDPDLELAGANAGANATQILRYITLPLALPGILGGTLLAFARALGEYGATITFAGSVEGRTRTLPLQIELALNSNQPDQALGIALMLIAMYIMVVVISAWALRTVVSRSVVSRGTGVPAQPLLASRSTASAPGRG
ncbi:molybdate ABC transporter permease subunit [Neomicrococcus aestuarii]|uniref:molybdate ABC transporter permease subunit n=1 Tax=Neomicrococcus aestuarii TaxID=556325 RepID=UPI000A008D34|nr:ABC transporter permease subunit [Neomicrococcus aestuarii]